MAERLDIHQLEADLGQAAALRVLANVGGQRRRVASREHADQSALAKELGPQVTRWLAERHGHELVEFPSRNGRDAENRAARLRAAVLEAGLTDATRSANDIAAEHGVSARRVEQLRQELRGERTGPHTSLPLFDRP